MMDLKIFALAALIGFLSALYHAGKPQDSGEQNSL
jgi:hypothetical protein